MARLRHRVIRLVRLVVLLAIVASLTLGSSAGVSISKDRSLYRSDRILVRFKPTLKESVVAKRVAARSMRLAHASKLVKNLCLVEVPRGKSVKRALGEFARDPDVLYAEPDYRLEAFVEPVNPNDERYSEQWAFYNVAQEVPPGSGERGTFDADIDANLAWALTTGSASNIVAVVDTGVDYTHSDLAPNMWRNTREIPGNGLDDDANGVPDDYYGINVVGVTLEGPGCGARSSVGDPMDDYGHGTHVAGIIGALTDNGRGVAGTNWRTRIMALKFLGADGGGYTSGAILCLEYLKMMKERGEPVVAVNASWGGGGYSRALYDAIRSLIDYDVLFVAAAGNDSLSNDENPSYPASYDLPNIISVAASNYNDELAGFSNFGRRSVHVAAPGERILSLGQQFSRDNPYVYMDGTSMATPFVTGLAALLAAREPGLDWAGIRNRILTGGDAKPAFADLTLTGKRINAYGTLTKTSIPLFAVARPLGTETLFAGTSLRVEAMSVRGADAEGPVSVTVLETSDSYDLADDGAGADIAVGDGVFAATIPLPSSPGTYTLRFEGPSGSEDVTVTVRKGYTYAANEEGYGWVDIEAGESAPITELDGADEGIAYVAPPFPVFFYTEPVTTLAVSPNGGIVVDPSSDEGAWLPPFGGMPTADPAKIIAPLWQDLVVDTTGPAASRVYTAVVDPDGDPGTPNRVFVVEWRNVLPFELWMPPDVPLEDGGEPWVPSDNGFTFQVVFYEDEPWKITYQYRDVDCGVEVLSYGAAGTVGVQYFPLSTVFSSFEPALHDAMAVDFDLVEGAAMLSVEPTADEGALFGEVRVGSEERREVYIRNSGDATATVETVDIVGPDPETPPSPDFSLVDSPAAPFDVPPDSVVTLTVSYAPSDRGLDQSVLQIRSIAGDYGVTLLGRGILDPDISVEPAVVNFGRTPVGRERTLEVAIANGGDATLTLEGLAFATGGAGFSLVDEFPATTLPSGESTTVAIAFAPERDGTASDRLVVYSDDPDESVVYVDLTGIGYTDEEAPAAFIDPAPEEPDGANGWYVTKPLVRLYANEEGAELYYQWDSTTGVWTRYADALTAPEGAHTLFCYAVDEAGNIGPLRQKVVRVDLTAPTASLRAPLFLSDASARLAVPVSWSGADALSGAGAYEVQYALGTSSSWSTWLRWTAAGSGSKPCAAGQTLRFRVRARDRAGNVGPWSAEARALVPLDDTAFAYSGAWSRVSNSALFAGSARVSARRGASATYRFVGARQLYLVVTKTPASGFADIYLGSRRVRTIDLYRSPAARRQRVLVASFAAPTSGTLRVVVRQAKRAASRGYAVEIDGLYVVR